MKQILAYTSDNHALLDNGTIPEIGFVTEGKLYNNSVDYQSQKVVVFHYGTNCHDMFFFEANKLVYSSVNLNSPEYLTTVYAECANIPELTHEQLIDRIISTYVFKMLGF